MSAARVEISGDDFQTFHHIAWNIERLFKMFEAGPAISLPRELVDNCNTMRELATKIVQSAKVVQGLDYRENRAYLDGVALDEGAMLEVRCPDGAWITAAYDGSDNLVAYWHGLRWESRLDFADETIEIRWPKPA